MNIRDDLHGLGRDAVAFGHALEFLGAVAGVLASEVESPGVAKALLLLELELRDRFAAVARAAAPLALGPVARVRARAA